MNMFKTINKDMRASVGQGDFTKNGKGFVESLRKYASAINNSRDRVQFILLIAAALDWEKDAFDETISRMNKIVIETNTGIQVDEFIKKIVMESEGKLKPLQ
ncbi:hypothetical protein JC777_00975 [Bacillus cytotoxicus]|uniref:Phage protein n=1 Tax=Bacillus cytotoxicus TaxID=580165 RepID=A0AAX2CKF5_9BACI|nr:hypothetical protein [Bacillus cytotoxicus]QTR83188.1 hypothetical protein JC777_00975 [Bacillus cytotoxicus]QTR86925.1 hypothetical protein JC774_20990 [Bacillus cytotoxicus]SCM00633.1 Uncharacterized protein BCB44BAC_03348 [Bacillus cytotoxicus]